MIISASRRTDIPALYSDWLISRLNAGYLLVKNPMNPNHVSRVSLSPDFVDCIVFWTKNPGPLIARLDDLRPYKYYFHFTLNPYNSTIEKNLPYKDKIIENFIKLSDKIGPEKIIWRYDPVFYTPDSGYIFHVRSFEHLANKLSGYTRRCMFSFLTPYAKCRKNMASVKYSVPDQKEQHLLLQSMAGIAKNAGIELHSCAMPGDCSAYGIVHGRCIDPDLVSRISGKTISSKKDPGQRKDCLCAESVDIGTYNTCTHGCLYCYANYNHAEALKNYSEHDAESELLTGELSGSEKIHVKGDTNSGSSPQLKLF